MILVAALAALATTAQAPAISADSAQAWFARNLDYLTRDGGRWLTDNATYVRADEPWVDGSTTPTRRHERLEPDTQHSQSFD